VRDGCTVGDLVARRPDGREIARHDGPVCVGDVWIIEMPAVPSSPFVPAAKSKARAYRSRASSASMTPGSRMAGSRR
jgi:hypothetical protein